MRLPVFAEHPECRRCDIAETCGPRTIGMRTIWHPESLPPSPQTPALVVVGKAPSPADDAAAEPFTGPEGNLVRTMLMAPPSKADTNLLTMASVYLTMSLRCHPKGIRDFTPTLKQLKACRHWLDEDLRTIAAHHSSVTILAGGREPCIQMMGLGVKAAIRTNPHTYCPSGKEASDEG